MFLFLWNTKVIVVKMKFLLSLILSHVGLNHVYIFTPCPKSILIFSSHLDSGIPSSLILLGLPKKFYANFSFPPRVLNAISTSFLRVLIAPNTVSTNHKLWRFSLRNLFPMFVTSSVLWNYNKPLRWLVIRVRSQVM
jgi:hypothetical protein